MKPPGAVLCKHLLHFTQIWRERPEMTLMGTDVQSLDVTDSSELLDLAEEVRRSGVGRLLKRGEHDLALLTPVVPHREARPRRQPAGEKRDALLNIIAIAASDEPTDIARNEQAYLAEAYTSPRR